MTSVFSSIGEMEETFNNCGVLKNVYKVPCGIVIVNDVEHWTR